MGYRRSDGTARVTVVDEDGQPVAVAVLETEDMGHMTSVAFSPVRGISF